MRVFGVTNTGVPRFASVLKESKILFAFVNAVTITSGLSEPIGLSITYGHVRPFVLLSDPSISKLLYLLFF